MAYVKKGKRAVLPHPFDATLAIVQLSKGYTAIVSIIDAVAVGAFNWSAVEAGRTVYAIRRTNGVGVLLHRFVAERSGMDLTNEIDHKDGNGLNCTRSNIRPATHQQNIANQAQQAGTVSGFRGVVLDKRRGTWSARAKINGRPVFFGSFDSKEAAHRAVVAGRAALWGEFGNRKEADA